MGRSWGGQLKAKGGGAQNGKNGKGGAGIEGVSGARQRGGGGIKGEGGRNDWGVTLADKGLRRKKKEVLSPPKKTGHD